MVICQPLPDRLRRGGLGAGHQPIVPQGDAAHLLDGNQSDPLGGTGQGHLAFRQVEKRLQPFAELVPLVAVLHPCGEDEFRLGSQLAVHAQRHFASRQGLSQLEDRHAGLLLDDGLHRERLLEIGPLEQL